MSLSSDNYKYLELIFSNKINSDFATSSTIITKNYLKKYDFKIDTLNFPLLIDYYDYEGLCKAAKILRTIQKKLLKYLLSRWAKNIILQFFNCDPGLEFFIDWKRLENGDEQMCRFDIIPSTNGYKFCEINADSSIAGFKLCEITNLILKHNNLKNYYTEVSPLQNLTEYLRTIITREKVKTLIVFGLSKYLMEGSGTVKHTYAYFKNCFKELKVILITEKDFEQVIPTLPDNKKIIFRIGPYDDISDQILLQNMFDTKAIIINSFETEIFSNKKWFSIFNNTIFHKMLTKEELATLNKYIPKTEEITSRNIPYLLKNKDKYVFKANISFGGKGIIFGDESSEKDLEKVLFKNHSNWTAQEKIISEKINFSKNHNNFNVVLGLYYINKNCSGLLVRLNSANRVVSGSLNGTKVGWALKMSDNERENFINDISSTNRRII